MRTLKKAVTAAQVDTPHSVTQIPPATMLFNRQIQAKLPQVNFTPPAHQQPDASLKARVKNKEYVDKHRHAKPSSILLLRKTPCCYEIL